jgi:hypothetical protein
MKVCNKEAMKIVKDLEEKKSYIVGEEERLCRTFYIQGEEKQKTDYDYAATRTQIAELDKKVRKIKHALAISNCTAVIDDFNISIGEALVYLAQLNDEYDRLSDLAGNTQCTREIMQDGLVIYREYYFNVKQVAKEAEELRKQINRLQIAIDRANLTNFIEI